MILKKKPVMPVREVKNTSLNFEIHAYEAFQDEKQLREFILSGIRRRYAFENSGKNIELAEPFVWYIDIDRYYDETTCYMGADVVLSDTEDGFHKRMAKYEKDIVKYEEWYNSNQRVIEEEKQARQSDAKVRKDIAKKLREIEILKTSLKKEINNR